MTIDLFISCVMDQFYPETAKNVMKILDAACVDVEYNPEQTCCGKFAFTSGFVEEAKELGEKFLNDFPNDRPIVGVSASCVGYIKTRYQELFYNTASHLEFKRVVRNIYELTDFLVNKIKVVDFGAEFDHKVVYQDTCCSLRELGLKDEGRKLLSHVRGLELLEMKRPEICCGFGGGFFSIQHEAICRYGREKNQRRDGNRRVIYRHKRHLMPYAARQLYQKTKVRYSGAAYSRCSCSENLE